MLSYIIMDMGRARDNHRGIDMIRSSKMNMISRGNNHRSVNMFWSRKMDMISRGNNHRGMDMVRNSNHSWTESTSNCRSSTSLIRPGIVGKSL